MRDAVTGGLPRFCHSEGRRSIVRGTYFIGMQLQQRLNAPNQNVDHVIAARRLATMLPQHLEKVGARDHLIVGAEQDARNRLATESLRESNQRRSHGRRLAILLQLAKVLHGTQRRIESVSPHVEILGQSSKP